MDKLMLRYRIAGVTVGLVPAAGMRELDNFAPFLIEETDETVKQGPEQVREQVPEHVIVVRAYDESSPPISGEDGLELISEDLVNRLYLKDNTLIKRTAMQEGDSRCMWTFMDITDFSRADVYVPSTWVDYPGVANAFMFEKMLLKHGAIMLHCSLIEYNNLGIAFTAPSQTGKSTQAQLWQDYRGAEQINGDRAILRVFEDGVYAYGSPWAGSSAVYVNRKIKLEAIVALSQAKQNTAVRLGFTEALQYFLMGTSLPAWDEDLLNAGLSAIEKALSGVKLVHLACTPDERAVAALEDYLFPDPFSETSANLEGANNAV